MQAAELILSHGKGEAWAGALRFVERRRWLRSEATGKSLGFMTRYKRSPGVLQRCLYPYLARG